MDIRGISDGFCFIKKKNFVWEKGSLDETLITSLTLGISMCEGVGEDSGQHDESHLISWHVGFHGIFFIGMLMCV